MARRLPIWDNHIHFRPEFLGVEGAKLFERAGGTALLLTHTPYEDVPINHGADYERAYRNTLSMAEAIRLATRLQVFVALGPYPVECFHLKEVLGFEGAVAAMKQGIDLAARHVAQGKAVAIGEIGRPHFPVGPDVIQACNDVMAYGMSAAKRLGCAVVLHTEDPTPQIFGEFAAIAAKVGLDRNRVVKHHSTPLTRPEDNSGLVPSILAKEELVTEALKGGPNFMLETDYIDDLRRPGAVLGPGTVPKKTKAWIEKGLLTEEEAWVIHKDVPERTYRIQLE
ncbi:MAG TPA: TatD family hydrolase [Thermoplasmata archaeon]|jgi:TatD-related deoxyribonuclease